MAETIFAGLVVAVGAGLWRKLSTIESKVERHSALVENGLSDRLSHIEKDVDRLTDHLLG